MPGASTFLALLVLTTLSMGCVEQATVPDDCGASSVQRQATLSGDRLDPVAIDVCKGQKVTIEILTQRAGDLHLHGYDDQAPEIPVEPGDTATFEITASRAGQFPIELHDEDSGEETEVGLLTIHES